MITKFVRGVDRRTRKLLCNDQVVMVWRLINLTNSLCRNLFVTTVHLDPQTTGSSRSAFGPLAIHSTKSVITM